MGLLLPQQASDTPSSVLVHWYAAPTTNCRDPTLSALPIETWLLSIRTAARVEVTCQAGESVVGELTIRRELLDIPQGDNGDEMPHMVAAW